MPLDSRTGPDCASTTIPISCCGPLVDALRLLKRSLPDSRAARAARARWPWARRCALLLLLPASMVAATVSTTGCLSRRGPSNVAQGLEYHPKQATFDPFFGELFRVQLMMGRAIEREAEIRSRLARKLGVAETSDLQPLAKALRQRAEQLALEGVTLHLVTSGLDPSEQSLPTVEFRAEGTAADKQQGHRHDAKCKCPEHAMPARRVIAGRQVKRGARGKRIGCRVVGRRGKDDRPDRGHGDN